MKKLLVLLVVSYFTYSCEEDVQLVFSETQIETSKAADIAINIPKAEGSETVSNNINKTLQDHIVKQSYLTDDTSNQMALDEALEQFDAEFLKFKADFPDSPQQWEFFVDGEVTYQSDDLICIALNTYLDTGGAHGNTNVTFFNFNPINGEPYEFKDLVRNSESLSELVEQRLKDHIKSDTEHGTMEDYFFGKDFQLPETLGFSDEGLIILYNTYEIASYAQGIIEFTIPLEDVDAYLTIY